MIGLGQRGESNEGGDFGMEKAMGGRERTDYEKNEVIILFQTEMSNKCISNLTRSCSTTKKSWALGLLLNLSPSVPPISIDCTIHCQSTLNRPLSLSLAIKCNSLQ